MTLGDDMSYIHGATLCSAMLFAVPAIGADTEGRFALRGFGTANCGQVVSAISERSANELQTFVDQLSLWLSGYLTHANRTTPDVFDIIPFGSERDLLAVIVSRCEKLPSDANFEATTAQVISVLSVHAVQNESPISYNPGMIPLRIAIIERVQQRLIELGYLSSSVDGLVGAETQSAIQAFRLSKNMNDDAKLDIDALLNLLIVEE